ncbi:phosphonate metabolism protein/1,5-bisphosphokinase (PRPP-forming) PhnN [Marinobacterium sediminicola]|uniref:Ribose 1,5-bisphosphate phosphokinase PhnN n=1 Tax=Marinobacterium sediminicola TaxID=518898 RepID=A0ABY1S2U8_9GAMM|nr:phosphonate metabolism protein/1,5-bisphosphokinase (PRPP-forming) PhnN [Marinobacterium sediminicola]ULG68515.1 phosphonate metabolism protein/1,5-bisphosphokinase (PRPP-forming) PhnN [Marinobacterium sediminicola]SMR76662.1 ribose 1,5-bisphosphokinase [Marinobacterium sediminicola]
MGKGTLFYLIGASGSGKDSLLEGCRRQLPPDVRCCIAHRYITRAANVGGENHIHLSEAEFHLREELGLFAMCWYSHGYHYGIGNEIDTWLNSGVHVLVNGSREYLPKAMTLYEELVPVLIHVPTDKLRQRLIKRGRETAEEIECRLARHAQMVATLPEHTLHVSNEGNLQQGIDALLSIVMANSLQKTGAR